MAWMMTDDEHDTLADLVGVDLSTLTEYPAWSPTWPTDYAPLFNIGSECTFRRVGRIVTVHFHGVFDTGLGGSLPYTSPSPTGSTGGAGVIQFLELLTTVPGDFMPISTWSRLGVVACFVRNVDGSVRKLDELVQPFVDSTSAKLRADSVARSSLDGSIDRGWLSFDACYPITTTV